MMRRAAMPSRYRPTNLFRIPEDSCSDDGTGIGPVAWVAILREGCLLVDIGEEQVPHEVVETAQGLLWQNPHPGWNEYSVAGAQWKGLRYYIQEEERSWTFACVYNSQQFSKADCSAWVMEIVEWTATVRQADSDWVEGGHHACQTLFAPLLQERLQRLATPSYDIISEEDEDGESSAFLMENQQRPLEITSPLAPPKPEIFDHRGSENDALVEIYESDDDEVSDEDVSDENEHPTLFDPPPIELRTSLSLCSIPEEQDSIEESFEDEIEKGEVVQAHVQSIWETTLADIAPSESAEEETEKRQVVYCTEYAPLDEEEQQDALDRNLQSVVEHSPINAISGDDPASPVVSPETYISSEPTVLLGAVPPPMLESAPIAASDFLVANPPPPSGFKIKTAITFDEEPQRVVENSPINAPTSDAFATSSSSSKTKSIVSFADPPVKEPSVEESPPTEDSYKTPKTPPSTHTDRNKRSSPKSMVTFADPPVEVPQAVVATDDSYRSPTISPTTSPARNNRSSPKSTVTFADAPGPQGVTDDSYKSPKISPNTSPVRKSRSSPGGSKLSPLRRKETVQEMVERLARKQPEKENSNAVKEMPAVTKKEEKNECLAETAALKNSDSESLTSTTVEEEEEFDSVSYEEQKHNGKEKSCLCWIPSPLPASKRSLLQ